jgi:hypothetical protein
VTGTSFERAKADHPLTASHVEHGLAGPEPGAIEHLVAHGRQLREHAAPVFGIPTAAAHRQPLRPDVTLLRRESEG